MLHQVNDAPDPAVESSDTFVWDFSAFDKLHKLLKDYFSVIIVIPE